MNVNIKNEKNVFRQIVTLVDYLVGFVFVFPDDSALPLQVLLDVPLVLGLHCQVLCEEKKSALFSLYYLLVGICISGVCMMTVSLYID